MIMYCEICGNPVSTLSVCWFQYLPAMKNIVDNAKQNWPSDIDWKQTLHFDTEKCWKEWLDWYNKKFDEANPELVKAV